jgi:mercuric transport protein
VNQDVTLSVTGMTCAACARTIERTLQRVPGVEQASVNFATSRASVQFDPQTANVPALVKAVRDVGYDVLELPAERISNVISQGSRGPRLRSRAFASSYGEVRQSAEGATAATPPRSHSSFDGAQDDPEPVEGSEGRSGRGRSLPVLPVLPVPSNSAATSPPQRLSIFFMTACRRVMCSRIAIA